jgi:hypothetical protein
MRAMSECAKWESDSCSVTGGVAVFGAAFARHICAAAPRRLRGRHDIVTSNEPMSL